MSAFSRTHWIKLYVEMLDDPKVGLLPDSVKWRWVSVLLLAGELNEDGYLPDVNDMAWRLHTNVETLQGEMRTLAGRGLVELRVYVDGNERWFIPAFADRQAPASSTERSRMSRHRGRQNSDATEMQRNAASSLHKQKQKQNTETEGDRARETNPALSTPKNPPSPPIVVTQIADRTPEGFRATNGYHPPTEPPTPEPRTPSPEVRAIGEMANAITDVTGVSAKLNWHDPKTGSGVGDLAADLVDAGYTAEQVRAHYGREPTAGLWHWYESDWRGKKGDRPRLKEIRETIAGAVHQGKPAAAPKRPAWQIAQELLDKKRERLGLTPAGATE